MICPHCDRFIDEVFASHTVGMVGRLIPGRACIKSFSEKKTDKNEYYCSACKGNLSDMVYFAGKPELNL